MIKTKQCKMLLIMLTAFVMIACSGTDSGSGEEEHKHEHEHEGPEGVVVLNKKQMQALNLKLGGFTMRNLTTVVKVNGQLEIAPENRAEITTLIGGNVKEIKVFHGDKVKKGQVLAILEHPDYIALQEEYAELANTMEYLEQEYQRQKQLYENKAGSGKDFQKAKSDYFVARAKYQGLRSRLRLLNISPEAVQSGNISNTIKLTSPINGFVSKVDVKLGTYVSPQDKLFEIADNSAIHVDFMVYEKDVYLLHKGQKLHFTVANRPGKEFTATVFAIGKEFETNTRAVHVHAQIDSLPEGLVPGMYITGHLHTDEAYVNTLPNDAIVREGTKSYIFILADDEALQHEAEHEHESEEHEHEAANHQGHIHEDAVGHADEMAFKMVEVITGKSDEGYTEVTPVGSLPGNVQVVQNVAYYLLADLKKEETEHVH
jgi:cobalt-zinc-cadmium efflux system membrane fusion protein